MSTIKGLDSFSSTNKDHAVTLTLFAGTAAAVGTLTSPIPYQFGDMKISTVSTAETITITASSDGVNYSATLLPFDLATGLDHATGALATGNYVLPFRLHSSFQFFKFTKSGAVNTGIVAVARITQIP
jgi:hypothetical protein